MELSSSSCAEIGVPIDLRRVSQGISGVAQRKTSQLSCMMGNGALVWSQCRGIGHHFKLIWATLSYFTFLRWHHCPSRHVRNFWGTLCSSVKQIKAPYLFYWVHGIALHAFQGNQASSFSEGEVSLFFSSWRKPGVHSRVTAGVAINNFCFFSDVRIHLWLRWTPQDSKLGLTEKYGRLWSSGRRPRLNFWLALWYCDYYPF